jgi:cell division inhibitor SepF
MPSVWRRTAVWLGLVDDDDEYEDYEPYVEPADRRTAAVEPEPGGGAVRTIAREEPGAAVQPRPAVVRPIQPITGAKPHVVAPSGFADAKEIGDKLKASQPVIVNLQGTDRDLCRRIIDFSSGLAYGLGGTMEKVAEQVFLLTPSNVEISAEERRRLQERGFRS